MRENTTGPVRGDRTAGRPGGSPAPTFSERDPAVPGGRGDQARVDDATARREPVTQPVPAGGPQPVPAGGAIPQQTDGQAARQAARPVPAQGGAPRDNQVTEQGGAAGVALPKQGTDGRNDGPSDRRNDDRKDNRKTGRRDDVPAGQDGSGQRAERQDRVDGATPEGGQLDGSPMPARTDDGASAATHAKSTAEHGDDTGAVLFGADTATTFRTRWRELQADFVDDPKRAVEGADKLVDEVLHSLTQTLTKHKQGLAGGWQDHGETEELRQALRKYRSFLDQLLKT